MTTTDVGRQILEQAHVAAAQHYVLRGYGGAQQLGAFEHRSAPPLFAESVQAALAEQIFKRLITVWQMRQFQRYDPAIVDERGAEARTKAEEQHAAALVAAERLHGRVVEDLHRPAEGRGPVEADPAFAEIPRLLDHLAADDRARYAKSDDVVFPVGGAGLDAGHHLRRREPITGIELARFGAARMHQLDVRATDVDHQNAHQLFSIASGILICICLFLIR